MEELVDYYPFGDIRIDEVGENNFNEQRKFTGHMYDDETELYYMNARYQNPGVGRFVSQDPAFLAVGDNEIILEKTNRTEQKILEDPQLLNSYSYARNNPLILIDEDGEFVQVAIGAGVGFVGGIVSTYVSDVAHNISGGAKGFSVFKSQTSLSEYGVRGVQGWAVGASVSTGGVLAPVFGGVAAGGTSILADKALGNEINYGQAGADALITAGTAGLVKSAPKVRGRLPNFGTKAFFTGKHAQHALLGEAVAVGIEYNTDLFSGLLSNHSQGGQNRTYYYQDSEYGSTFSTPAIINSYQEERK